MNQRLRRSPPDVVYTPIDVTSSHLLAAAGQSTQMVWRGQGAVAGNIESEFHCSVPPKTKVSISPGVFQTVSQWTGDVLLNQGHLGTQRSDGIRMVAEFSGPDRRECESVKVGLLTLTHGWIKGTSTSKSTRGLVGEKLSAGGAGPGCGKRGFAQGTALTPSLGVGRATGPATNPDAPVHQGCFEPPNQAHNARRAGLWVGCGRTGCGRRLRRVQWRI